MDKLAGRKVLWFPGSHAGAGKRTLRLAWFFYGIHHPARRPVRLAGESKSDFGIQAKQEIFTQNPFTRKPISRGPLFGGEGRQPILW